MTRIWLEYPWSEYDQNIHDQNADDHVGDADCVLHLHLWCVANILLRFLGVARHLVGEGLNLQHSAKADFHYFNQHFQHYHYHDDDDHHHDHDDHNAHQVSEPESAPDQWNSDNLSYRTAPVSWSHHKQGLRLAKQSIFRGSRTFDNLKTHFWTIFLRPPSWSPCEHLNKWVDPGDAWPNYAWWGRPCICHGVRWSFKITKMHRHCFPIILIVIVIVFQVSSTGFVFRRSWCLSKPLWATAWPMDGRSPFYDHQLMIFHDHHFLIMTVWWSSLIMITICLSLSDDDHYPMMFNRWVWTLTTGTWSASRSSSTTSPSSPPATPSPAYFARRYFHFHFSPV